MSLTIDMKNIALSMIASQSGYKVVSLRGNLYELHLPNGEVRLFRMSVMNTGGGVAEKFAIWMMTPSCPFVVVGPAALKIANSEAVKAMVGDDGAFYTLEEFLAFFVMEKAAK